MGLSALLLAGCDRADDVRSYTVEKKDDHHVSPLLGGPGNPPQDQQATGPQVSPLERVQWTMPEGWHQERNPRPMILAVFHPNSNHKPDIEVSAFPGDVGGVLANINRWRNQIQLPPITDAVLHEHIDILNTQGSFGGMMDAVNPQTGRRTIAVIIQDGQGMSWFIKATDADALVSAQKAAIKQFAESFRFVTPGSPQAQGHQHTHTHPAPAAAAQTPTAARPAAPAYSGLDAITFTTPSHWKMDATPPSMLLAGYDSTTPAGVARVTIARLHGDGGGLLPNINRWRGQIGLPPVPSLAMQPVALLEVPGAQVTLVDLAGAAEGSFAGQRILMGVIARPGETWYFKLTGDNAVADEQKASFIAAIESIRFKEGQ